MISWHCTLYHIWRYINAHETIPLNFQKCTHTPNLGHSFFFLPKSAKKANQNSAHAHGEEPAEEYLSTLYSKGAETGNCTDLLYNSTPFKDYYPYPHQIGLNEFHYMLNCKNSSIFLISDYGTFLILVVIGNFPSKSLACR